MKLRTAEVLTPGRLRRHWRLKPGTVFLNHGSFGACPSAVLNFQTELRARMEAEPVQFLWRHYDELLQASREVVARFVGARPQDLVFTTNATTGVNAVLRSFQLKAGDEIVATDHGYNACHNALIETARRARARLVTVRIPFPVANAQQIAEKILGAVTRRTRLAVVDHVTSTTALVFPLREIIRDLESRGVRTLIDGAHAPGMVPLNLSRLSPSYYAANLHKWVCAPKGSAFLWVRPDGQSDLQPAVISHGNNTHRAGYSSFQDRFDWAGTFDPSAWFCVGKAIEWMENLLPGGWPEIRAANRELAIQARRLICQRLSIDPPCPPSLLGSMITLPLPAQFQGVAKTTKIDPEQCELYDRHRIEVPLFRRGKPEVRYFRVSAYLYNNLAEYEYLAEKLAAFLPL